MRAHRAELVRLSLPVLVDGHWLRGETVMEHAAAVDPEIFDILDVGLQVPLVLHVDLDIMFQHGGHRLGNAGHTTGLVEGSPGILDAADLICQ